MKWRRRKNEIPSRMLHAGHMLGLLKDPHVVPFLYGMNAQDGTLHILLPHTPVQVVPIDGTMTSVEVFHPETNATYQLTVVAERVHEPTVILPDDDD